MEIWGIGYVSSEHEADDDEADMEEEGDESIENDNLRDKIFKQDEIDLEGEDFEQIYNQSKLRDAYSYRWWKDSDPDNYFVMINWNKESIKPGEQIFYNYGRRSNFYLMSNYGFCLDEINSYDELQFRVILGINPKGTISLA